jgi:hypothetical protein
VESVEDATLASGRPGRNGIADSSMVDDDIQNSQCRRVIHDAVDRNASLPSNLRSKQTTQDPPATEGNTEPQVQVPELLDGEKPPAIRGHPINHAEDARKRFGPDVPVRAKSLKDLSDYRAIGPGTASHRASLGSWSRRGRSCRSGCLVMLVMLGGLRFRGARARRRTRVRGEDAGLSNEAKDSS